MWNPFKKKKKKKFEDVPFKSSNDNGQLISEGTYKDGVHKEYREDGILSSEDTYKDGKRNGSCINYWDGTQISMITHYKDDILHGVSKLFYDTGELESQKEWKNGKIIDGPFIKYHPNGKIRQESNYSNGELNGFSRWFYENGTIKYVGVYKDGKLDGMYKRYSPHYEGQLLEEGIYKDGVIIDSKEY